MNHNIRPYAMAFLLMALLLTSCKTTSTTGTNLLSEKEIIRRIINAKGGKANLKRVKSLKMVMEIPEQKARAVALRISPDKLVDSMYFSEGTYVSILNGREHMFITPYSRLPLEEGQLRSVKTDATIFPELYSRKLRKTYSYMGKEKLEGKWVHKVKMSFPDQDYRIQCYDYNTWLLHLMIDEYGSKFYFEGYEDVDGIPFYTSLKMIYYKSQDTTSFQVKKVEINPELDETMFEIK